MNKPFNGLTDAEAERLAKLAEECSEVIKTICKIYLHGYQSTDPTFQVEGTNKEQLEKEIGDVQWAVSMMVQKSDISQFAIMDARDMKIKKFVDGKCYLHHQHD